MHVAERAAATRRAALVGNPNCGKTSLYNALTGGRQKVANYAGVTVERKTGRLISTSGAPIDIIDLPGAYSFNATSPDEAITRDVCQGKLRGEPAPDLIVCVVSATNLRLHLRFALEVRALGKPMILALNMTDAAQNQGISIDTIALEREFGAPVVETIAVRHNGAAALAAAIEGARLDAPRSVPSSADLHADVSRLLAAAVREPASTLTIDDAIDRWTLHPVAGLAILALVLLLVFQGVFLWAQPLMNGLQAGIDLLSAWLTAVLPAGVLRSLLVDGIVAGAGSVLVFVPQILMLFAFIFVLEDSGYLPRAAFLLDRLMVGAGLTGRSFIPLLSSFACAVPGIMATRSIPDLRDRFATIAVAPLMTCSARLPVYTLLISAFIPARKVFGVFDVRGLTLFALYVAGIAAALAVSSLFRLLRRDTTEHALLLELPPYRWPNPRDIALSLWERARIFVFDRVGKIIVASSVILWFVSTFPGAPAGAIDPAINYSIAGYVGHALHIVFAPIGFSWQICVSLIPGMAAREVVISSLATTYALSAAADAGTQKLAATISSQWSMATAYSLLAWFVFSPQCISTLAVIRRETNSWRGVSLVAGYLVGLAYLAAFVTYRVALAFGAGAHP